MIFVEGVPGVGKSTTAQFPESFLMQRPVFTMLPRDVSVDAIEELVNRFADAVAPLRATLLYLSHPDPMQAWSAAMTARGPDEFLSPVLTVCSSRNRRRRSPIARRSSIGRRDWSRCTSKARSRVLHHVNEFASCCRYGTYVETHE